MIDCVMDRHQKFAVEVRKEEACTPLSSTSTTSDVSARDRPVMILSSDSMDIDSLEVLRSLYVFGCSVDLTYILSRYMCGSLARYRLLGNASTVWFLTKC